MNAVTKIRTVRPPRAGRTGPAALDELAQFQRGPKDAASYAGSLRLKEKIEAYWRARGRTAVVTLENGGANPHLKTAHVVTRSNIVNGFPPRAKGRRS
ncbi:MAG: hypothetical protein ABL308_12835 [Oceanicaulis sp.]